MASNDDLILLVELTGYSDVASSTVYRYATREYRTEPADTPANTPYEGRVIDAGFLRRRLFGENESGIATSGVRPRVRGEVDFGAVVLNNIDGELDAIFGVASISFRERQIRLLKVYKGQPYSTAQVVYRAAISQVSHRRESVTISVKDRSYELASPHWTAAYLGNNALPAGVEGSSDLAGKTKPKGYGKVLQWAPPLVNTSKYIYQVNDGAIQSVEVFDGASALTRGTDYASQADMEANAPAAGTYRVWLAGGMFRIETKPTHKLTADVTYSTTANSSAAQVLKQMALDRGVASGDISASDVTALDALNAAVTGVVIDSTMTTLEAMDEIARSIGAFYYFDQLGVLRMGRFDAPSGTAVAVVANWNDATLEQATNGEDVPALDVRLQYARYETPLSQSEIATSVSAAIYADVQLRTRDARYTGTVSPNPHKRTQILERETRLVLKTAADAEAQRLFNLASVAHRTHVVSNVFLDDENLALLDLNKVIELRWDRHGFDPVTGTLRLVIAITFHFSAMRCDLTLWGS